MLRAKHSEDVYYSMVIALSVVAKLGVLLKMIGLYEDIN
jgi:hypothetical protein